MGLDTTHDCWHGAYSAFNEWRNRVAVAAGYGIRETDIDGNPRTGGGLKMVDLEYQWFTEDRLMGIWDRTPDDPLLVLIVHHDHDGAIYPPQQLALADRLDELKDHPYLMGQTWGHIERRGGYRGALDRFVAGLRLAHSRGETVGFR